MWTDETPETYLLIATGFEDDFVGCCLQMMQQLGIRVVTVGMTQGETVGALGGKISPDLSLDHVSYEPMPSLIILSGGQACANAWAIDPRSHLFVREALEKGCKFAFGRGGEHFLSPKNQQKAQFKSQLIFQQGQETGAFIRSLASYCVPPSIPNVAKN